jgi:nitronate monooxygenase
MGSRFWATRESLAHPRHRDAALAADGDGTVRQRATDIARGYDWPPEFSRAVLHNRFVRDGKDAPMRTAPLRPTAARLPRRRRRGRPGRVGVFVGEAAG